jgi:hypothetical protein
MARNPAIGFLTMALVLGACRTWPAPIGNENGNENRNQNRQDAATGEDGAEQRDGTLSDAMAQDGTVGQDSAVITDAGWACDGVSCGDWSAMRVVCPEVRSWPCYPNASHCLASIVPTMSAYSSMDGSVIMSSCIDSQNLGWHAFDDELNDIWVSGSGLPEWIGFSFPTRTHVSAYAITFNNPGPPVNRAPVTFSLEAGDGTDWVVLDDQTSITGWTGCETRLFFVETPGEYLEYRLYVSQVAGSTVVSIGELDLLD